MWDFSSGQAVQLCMPPALRPDEFKSARHRSEVEGTKQRNMPWRDGMAETEVGVTATLGIARKRRAMSAIGKERREWRCIACHPYPCWIRSMRNEF